MNSSDIKKLLPAAVIFFAAAAALFRPEIFVSGIKKLSGALIPIVIGVILAAVIEPGVGFFERLYLKLRGGRSGKICRYFAIATVYLMIVGVITAVIWIIIPKLIDNITLFAGSIDGYYNDFRRRCESGAERDALGILTMADRLLAELTDRLPEIFGRTFTATAGFIKTAGYFLVGAVLSVYVLADKKRLLDFISSAAQAAMSEKTYKKTARVIGAVNSCLVNFISGQLAEAVVLGSLCFAGMVVFGFEYPLLISTIIGVTALVPVAGAFIGAVPSVLVLFLAKPSSAMWFIVFIIVLQQLENNIIYPRVVGKSVGLPPLLILISIIAGAELGGALGIMLGIPLMSAAYMLAKESIEKRAAHSDGAE
ncbi:MAG: AI-2E family transporter [Ruminococcus sp.]|nr:AI-2E family transporter [Ruminococcus sp.]